MAPYTESVTVIDTPFSDSLDSLLEGEWDYWHGDPVLSVQRRMLLILGIVALLVTTFSLVIAPRATGSNAGDRPVQDAGVAAVSSPGEFAATDTNNQPSLSATGSGAIASFFTTEVQHWAPQIIRWADEHDLDPNIVATIMQIESCGDPQAVSVAGARGLFQVMPFHFSGGEDMLDPDTNARRGLAFFNEQLRYTGGDVLLSFAGYNGGYAASGGMYENWASETQRYYQWAKGIYEDAAAGNSTSETLTNWLAAGGGAGCERAASRLAVN
jgi:hypothetical protein